MNKYMYILRGLWLYNNNWNIYYEKKCLYYICKRIYLNIGKKLFVWDNYQIESSTVMSDYDSVSLWCSFIWSKVILQTHKRLIITHNPLKKKLMVYKHDTLNVSNLFFFLNSVVKEKNCGQSFEITSFFVFIIFITTQILSSWMALSAEVKELFGKEFGFLHRVMYYERPFVSLRSDLGRYYERAS